MGRRRWSADERARILEETFVPGAVVSAVARLHGLTPQQLFTWRRAARTQLEAEAPPGFVPAVVVAPEPMAAKEPRRRAPRRCVAAIELEASGVTVRIGDGTSPATIAAVIRALKVPS
ncbi:transposase (plasmid) [Mesorhizobium sp. INR15]|nr:transposase [Mesorhizobium sp. INR15]